LRFGRGGSHRTPQRVAHLLVHVLVAQGRPAHMRVESQEPAPRPLNELDHLLRDQVLVGSAGRRPVLFSPLLDDVSEPRVSRVGVAFGGSAAKDVELRESRHAGVSAGDRALLLLLLCVRSTFAFVLCSPADTSALVRQRKSVVPGSTGEGHSARVSGDNAPTGRVWVGVVSWDLLFVVSFFVHSVFTISHNSTYPHSPSTHSWLAPSKGRSRGCPTVIAFRPNQRLIRLPCEASATPASLASRVRNDGTLRYPVAYLACAPKLRYAILVPRIAVRWAGGSEEVHVPYH
jgi:hypothetical protein